MVKSALFLLFGKKGKPYDGVKRIYPCGGGKGWGGGGEHFTQLFFDDDPCSGVQLNLSLQLPGLSHTVCFCVTFLAMFSTRIDPVKHQLEGRLTSREEGWDVAHIYTGPAQLGFKLSRQLNVSCLHYPAGWSSEESRSQLPCANRITGGIMNRRKSEVC